MSCQGQSVICQPWSITHPHPTGEGLAEHQGTPRGSSSPGGLCLCSVSWAVQGAELPAPSPAMSQDRRENGKKKWEKMGKWENTQEGLRVLPLRFLVPHKEEFFPHFPPASPSAHLPQTFNPRVLWMLQTPTCGFCVLMGSEDPLPGFIPGFIPGQGRVSPAAQTLPELRAQCCEVTPSLLPGSKPTPTPSLAGPPSASRTSLVLSCPKGAPRAGEGSEEPLPVSLSGRASSSGVKPGRAGGWTGVKVVAPSIPAQSQGPESGAGEGAGALPCPPP